MAGNIENQIYHPLLHTGKLGDAAVEELSHIWTVYKTLPQEKKNILMSDELPERIIAIQERFGLSDASVGAVTIIIRMIFFGELSPEQAEAKIGSMLVTSGGDPNQAKVIVDFIKSDIMTIKPRPKAPELSDDMPAAPVTESLPLLQAITKYEKLSQQIITNERIRVKSQAEPVRPSLVNWIKCYRDELGVGFHDSVQRGTFLFRSENCKRLTPPERERVNLILKSIEESYPLPIDTAKSEILFPEYAALRPQAEAPTVQPQTQPMSAPQPLAQRMPVPENAPARIPSAAAAPSSESPLKGAFLGGGMGIYKSMPQELTPQGQSESTRPNAPSHDESSGAGAVSFSSNHVFPAEKEAVAQPAAPVVPAAPRPVPKVPTEQPNPFRIRPVSRSEEE